jgi:DNA-binding NarL/FixJ family response regulator
MTIRVLLADDDALVRAGLALILGGSPAIEVVGEAPDGQEAVRRVRDGGIDVVLMDIRMPVMDGIAATAEVLALPDPPKVIVLTTFDADEYVVRALAAGANGFLLKDTPPADIVDAIGRVVEGEPILSPTITEQLIRQVTDAMPDARAGEARARRVPDRPRARGSGGDRAGFVQRRDRGHAAHERGHREGAHLAHLHQARGDQPRPGRDRDARGPPAVRPLTSGARRPWVPRPTVGA